MRNVSALMTDLSLMKLNVGVELNLESDVSVNAFRLLLGTVRLLTALQMVIGTSNITS